MTEIQILAEQARDLAAQFDFELSHHTINGVAPFLSTVVELRKAIAMERLANVLETIAADGIQVVTHEGRQRS